jgi:hypothetical protein
LKLFFKKALKIEMLKASKITNFAFSINRELFQEKKLEKLSNTKKVDA